MIDRLVLVQIVTDGDDRKQQRDQDDEGEE